MSLAPRVKICGVTRVEDALSAVACGADALGLNFWPGGPRHCSVEQARAISAATPPLVSLVGVFVDTPASEVRSIARTVGLHAIQLHGDERLAPFLKLPWPILRAIRIAGPDDLGRLEPLPRVMYLLDASGPLPGGTGRRFDWRLLERDRPRVPFVLAGGLSPRNVRGAVRRLRPYGVDVASGVESAPGLKDAGKMRRFVKAAKEEAGT